VEDRLRRGELDELDRGRVDDFTPHARAADAPRELVELTARIEQLRVRLKAGDPDMTADEIEAAIARAESKRLELEEAQPGAKAGAKLLAMIPNAAELYRRQIAAGVNGDARAVLTARVALRGLLSPIRVDAEEDRSVRAHYECAQQP
jgi:site-specific DNA recombinase